MYFDFTNIIISSVDIYAYKTNLLCKYIKLKYFCFSSLMGLCLHIILYLVSKIHAIVYCLNKYYFFRLSKFSLLLFPF